MTTEQLKNFLAVADVLNFHKASSNIHIAQPALSRQIKNLEREVGAELFDRTKKQIRITPAGVFFKNEVSRILEHLNQASRKAGQIHKGEAGDIKIGHVSSAMQSVLPHFLKKITTSYPEMKIALSESGCDMMFRKIRDHELDFGIMPNEVAPEGFESEMLYKENFVIVMPKNLKVSLSNGTSLKPFAKFDWILPARDDGRSYTEILYGIFQKNGFSPKVVFQSPNASTNLRLVSEGLGVTIIAKSAIKMVNLNIKYFELTDMPTKIDMRFYWLKERKEELRQYIQLFLPIFRAVKIK